jgi:hypothetical protein
VLVGLKGHQVLAEPALGERPHLVQLSTSFHAAGLAAAAGVDLHLDDPAVAADLLRRLDGFVGGVDGIAARHRQAILRTGCLA